ncbi:hypothetical protein SYNPS1DRAFT_22392, partial [Syncephalis pseudoplumigaleata]
MASVASSNPFAFLNDDDEGNNIVPSTAVAPAAPKDKKQAAKDKKATKAAAATPAAKPAASVEKSRAKPAARPAAEGRNYEAESREANRARRGGAAPRRGARGARGGGRGREFDRHSATGLTDSNKKIEQGWGHTGADYSEADKAAAKNTEEVIEEVPAEEQEPATKTLDEYLSERTEKLKLAGIDVPEARKVETVEQWKNTRVLKPEEDHFFVGKAQSTTQKQKKKKQTKVVVEIEQRFVEENSFGR